MGYDAYSYAVVGLAISSGELYRCQKIAAFNHEYPKTMNFCPTTGIPLWKEEITFVDGTDPEIETFQGFDVMKKDSQESIKNPKSINLVGEQLRSDSDSFWTEDKILDIKNRMKEKLKPFGLWNEDKFGVYPVLYESY